jgi:hypothetical protein
VTDVAARGARNTTVGLTFGTQRRAPRDSETVLRPRTRRCGNAKVAVATVEDGEISLYKVQVKIAFGSTPRRVSN